MIAIGVSEWPGMNPAFLARSSHDRASRSRDPDRQTPPSASRFVGRGHAASTYAFSVMFLAFGIVPHQWIDHADKDLGWSKDNIIYGPGEILKPQASGGWLPITLQYEASATSSSC